MLLYDRGKKLALETKESIEDLAAEAKEEIAETPKRKQVKKAA
jgi:hypothetical protein